MLWPRMPSTVNISVKAVLTLTCAPSTMNEVKAVITTKLICTTACPTIRGSISPSTRSTPGVRILSESRKRAPIWRRPGIWIPACSSAPITVPQATP